MKNSGRVLGIDYGSKRVGVAMTDPLRVIAQGVGTLDNAPELLDKLKTVIEEQGVVLVVVGMPYAADGGMGQKALEVQRFIDALRAVVAVPVETWDESYSSVAAQRALIGAGMRKKQRREKRRVDEMAARLLLQEYLEYHH